MDPHSIIEMSDRAREVFRQTVEAYLASGSPIGSRTLAKVSGLGLSPASIRNVMQDLEELGLLAAPHTSAGRMPTELGLRLFVDGMMQTAELSRVDRAAIEEHVKGDGNRVEDVLARAITILSGLSSCAGIVLVPKSELVLRQISFVPLSPERALAIIVGADGVVENRVLELTPGLPSAALVHASNFINARLTGLTLAQAAARLREEIGSVRHELDELARSVVEKGIALWSSDGDSRPILIVRGQSHLLDETSTADLERLRLLLGDLEGKEELVQLLEMARDGQGMKIFIGSENKLFSLSGSSVIAAPYRSAGSGLVGVVGVIGPTRLNYARVVPMVDYTAKALSRLIG